MAATCGPAAIYHVVSAASAVVSSLEAFAAASAAKKAVAAATVALARGAWAVGVEGHLVNAYGVAFFVVVESRVGGVAESRAGGVVESRAGEAATVFCVAARLHVWEVIDGGTVERDVEVESVWEGGSVERCRWCLRRQEH